MTAGYRTGLFTSPHLKDFRERIRIDGQEISEEEVVEFVERNREAIDRIQPSFFEITTAIAFDCFARHGVEIAVIEVGMGGRLDSTNIIRPMVSVITNIGYDHMQFLGDTLEKIAGEKAGIIKSDTPVVIGETQPETAAVFIEKARSEWAPIRFADQMYRVIGSETVGLSRRFEIEKRTDWRVFYPRERFAGNLSAEKCHDGPYCTGPCSNESGVCTVLPDQIRRGIALAARISGLKGRWQRLGERPVDRL